MENGKHYTIENPPKKESHLNPQIDLNNTYNNVSTFNLETLKITWMFNKTFKLIYFFKKYKYKRIPRKNAQIIIKKYPQFSFAVQVFMLLSG